MSLLQSDKRVRSGLRSRFRRLTASICGPRVGVADVRKAEHASANLNDAELRRTAIELRAQAAEGSRQPTQLSFCGLIGEAVFREFGFRLHNCQVQALLAGEAGNILEMQTGEGKTVVSGAIAALRALTDKSVHVSTTNDYLAGRDLDETRGLFDRLGFTSSLLPAESNETESRRAYKAQIVYGPGYQLGFDYLRDQMHLRRDRPDRTGRGIVNRIRRIDPFENMLQPGEFHVAIVDEADSVMIDEALTPLIISLPSGDVEDPRAYSIAKRITEGFEEGVDYRLEPSGQVEVTDTGHEKAHDAIAGERDLTLVRPWRVYIANALQAQHQFERDVQYVVVDGEVQLVDQNTGRIQPDRRWQSGLHQAIECKECVPIQAGRDSTAQVTRQRFLQRYSKLIGLTGTAMAASNEFRRTYGCRVTAIPTNRPCLREQLPMRCFGSLDAKYEAIAIDVAARHSTGQPVLVGTKTVRESLEACAALEALGLQPVVLNGVQDQEEAEIVGAAGKAGAITIATNMAGRGTDIKPDRAALEAGGLHVVGVSVNDSPRIDRQLAGRAARQGQPGSCQFFVSADDSILEKNESPLIRRMHRSAGPTGESRSFAPEIAKLQERIEAKHYEQRQAMMLRDRWMDTVRESIEKT